MIISWRRFWRSFRYARRGLQRALATENSFRIHVLVAAIISFCLIALRVSGRDAAIIILIMASILNLELVNTIVERFVDILEPRVHPYVGVIKDLMAAAVLIMSIAAILIAMLVLGPYLTNL